MAHLSRITTCLWFAGQAEAAAHFYVSVFKNSKITQTVRYGEAGKEHHRQKPGSVMTVAFELDGHSFTALNGPPMFKFNESISFQVMCDDQGEIDYFWEKLSAGGDPKAQQCGWLKDQFGVSWQVVPRILPELLKGDPAKSERIMAAVMQMKKFDIAKLQAV